MRIALVLLVLAGCSSSVPITEGPSPVDLGVSALVLSNFAATSPDPAATLGAANRAVDATPRFQAKMLVSLLNISDRPRRVSRFDLDPAVRTDWRIDPVRHRVNRMLDSGEEMEFELPVNVARVATGNTYRGDLVVLRAVIALESGEVYQMNLEVPVVQAR